MSRVKKVNMFLVILTCFCMSINAQAALQWGSEANVMTDHDGNPVPTNDELPVNSTLGAFAQLIRIMVGDTPGAFTGAGNGTDGINDIVMSTMFSGQYDELSDAGTFTFNTTAILANSSFDGNYYVRVFDKPLAGAEFANGTAASVIGTGPGYYWQSTVYAYTHDEMTVSEYTFGPGQTNTQIVAIPEPTTFAFIGIGLGAFFIRRKIRA